MSQCIDCSQNKSSDTKYPSCPAKMSDGRHFTDYRPRCITNSQNMSVGSYEFRQYMINNAEKLLEEKRNTMRQCGPCVDPFNIGTMLPEESYVKCDKNTCIVVGNDPSGLGQGRFYGEITDVHKKFLQDRENESNMGNCCNKSVKQIDNKFNF
jgi:hypothetical protein